jgi:hypothetical protein
VDGFWWGRGVTVMHGSEALLDMSKCPDCGREQVSEPAGYEALCGRRVTGNDAPAVLYPSLGSGASAW